MLAVAGDDPLVHLFDVRTGRLVREFEQDVGGVPGLEFSPDGRTLAISGKPDASLWDVATATQVGRLPGGGRRAMLDLARRTPAPDDERQRPGSRLEHRPGDLGAARLRTREPHAVAGGVGRVPPGAAVRAGLHELSSGCRLPGFDRSGDVDLQ